MMKYTPVQGRGFVRPGESEKPCYRVFSGIKKAVPIWNRLSEQLTRCAVCVNNHKPEHDNRDQAGGQLPCLLGPYCAAIFIRSEREYFFRNSSRTKAHGANLSDSCSSAIFSCSLFVFCDGVLVDSLLVIVCTCKAMRRSTSRHGADSNYSDSLALRRWRRLISPRMAVTINCAVLSPVSFTCSIASTTSCGARACNFCDLLLIWSLSISASLCDYWNPVYTKKTKTKRLKWIPLSDYTGIQLSVYHSMQTRLKRIAVLSQPLTTNDSKSIEAAMRNHITHPQGRDSHNLNKFTWRFMQCLTGSIAIFTVTAATEREARARLPHAHLIFVARIRQEASHG
ncbi:host cell division inhibitor Icd-like protein [Escherichia coli]